MNSSHPKRPTSVNSESWDAWSDNVSELSRERERELAGETEERVGLFSGVQRFFVLLFWRPVATVAYILGLAYGSICIFLFAHGELIEPYGFVDHGTQQDIATIPASTLVVSREGVLLMVLWLTVPPIWFFIEGYVLCKSNQQRAIVKEAQEISIKVWLAMLGVMAILAK